MKKAIHTIGIILLANILVLAETNISGKVTDDSGEPLIGANVFIKDSYDGASTDVNGDFFFETAIVGEAILMISYIGYEDASLKISLEGKNLPINIKLKESINKMDGVVISAGTFQGGTGTKSEVLKPLDIVTTAGATADIAGALNSLPGTQTVGEEGRLFVRGGAGYETKTFIDGMQVLKPYSTNIPNSPTRGRFSPFMFSGTSFSTGGYSAEYGQALSSALILNTKEKPSQTRSDLSIMSVGAELSHTQSWAKSSVAVQGAYYNLNPYFSAIKQSTDWDSEPVSQQLSMAARQQVGNTGMLKLYTNLSSNQFAFYQQDILDPSNKSLVDIKNDYAYANTSIKNTIGNSWTYKTGLAYTVNTDDIKLADETIKEVSKGGHLKSTFSGDITNWLSLNTGTEFLYSESRIDYRQEADGLVDIVNFQNPLIAGFAETDIYISKNLLARIGGRVEYTTLNSQLHISPRVSFAYKTGENAQVAFAAGSFRQSAPDSYLRLNNKLNSEKADHLILNYQWVSSTQTFRVEGYIKQYQQLIKFNPDQPYVANSYSNTGSGFARGIDIFWRDNKTIKDADYWISYSFLDTERDYQDFPATAVPSFASMHNLSVVYKHFVTDIKTQFSGTFTYGSPRAYNDPNSSDFNGGRTPSYVDLSLSISYLATQSIIVYGSLTNVLGRENIFGYTYSRTPNDQGSYVALANTLPAKRFLFIGVFITFSKDPTLNQLKSL